MKKTYIDTAMERIAPDLILKGGNVVDVFSGRVIKADVIIKDGIICGVGSYSGENEQDVSGKYIMPGFIVRICKGSYASRYYNRYCRSSRNNKRMR